MFTGIIHDLTEQVRMEGALRQQALLLELSYEPIFVWDAQWGIVLRQLLIASDTSRQDV